VRRARHTQSHKQVEARGKDRLAVRLIEALSRSDKTRGVTELGRELRFTKSNVHCLLETLVAHGYVRRRDPGQHELSLKF
jgi:DNA-binding IclR family transcriptional regulator